MRVLLSIPKRFRARSLRAFTLIEMLILISIISVILLAAAQLFSSMTTVLREARRAESAVTRLETALRQLRGDAWGAASVEVADDGASVSFQRPHGRPVRWSFDADAGTLARWKDREADEPERQWEELPAMRFEAQRAGALLRVDGGGARGESQIVLPSQLRLLPGSEP